MKSDCKISSKQMSIVFLSQLMNNTFLSCDSFHSFTLILSESKDKNHFSFFKNLKSAKQKLLQNNSFLPNLLSFLLRELNAQSAYVWG